MRRERARERVRVGSEKKIRNVRAPWQARRRQHAGMKNERRRGRRNDESVGGGEEEVCFTSTSGGKEEMGHIKGSLGHGGWYLTQIHIFHSDGRGTVEGSGRVRVGCVWVVGLLEHAGGGWLARRGGVGPRVSGRKRWCASVYTCAQVCARVEWVGIRVDRTGLVRSCHEGSWYAGTQACGAPASPPPPLLSTLSPPTPV